MDAISTGEGDDEPNESSRRDARAKRNRLRGIMVLAYAMQGSWWPLLAVHLHDLGMTGRERGWIFATLPLACLVMPLGAGQLVDRFFPIQRYMAATFAAGSFVLWFLALDGPSEFWPLFCLMAAFWLLTAPAMLLTNPLTLRNLDRPNEQFAGVRLWGTVGWFAVGWVVSAMMLATDAILPVEGRWSLLHGPREALLLGAALASIAALYCLFLPHTPPIASAKRPSGLRSDDLSDLVRNKTVLLLLVTAFGVSLTTPFMYQVIPPYLETKGLPRAWISTVMSIGQIPEILALIALPWMVRRIGFVGTIALGLFAWMVRFASLAGDPPLWVAIAGVPLHGVAIAYFSIAAAMYLDQRAPDHRRASTQAVYVVTTSGVGSMCGSLLGGTLVDLTHGRYDLVFLVACLINLGLVVGWLGVNHATRSPAVPPSHLTEHGRIAPPASAPAWK